jgi:hypothetical protein
MLKLYKYEADFDCFGSLDGIFVADDVDIANAIGRSVYFGEILGKHSEVTDDLTEDSFEVVTDDQDFIQKFQALGCESGWNPVKLLRRRDEEESVSV